jgi:hypothetical protein
MSMSVDGSSETDIGEQRQGIADVADGELFHGRVSLVQIFKIIGLGFFSSVRIQFETDISEQRQGVADVTDGELFHGHISFLLVHFVLVKTIVFI